VPRTTIITATPITALTAIASPTPRNTGTTARDPVGYYPYVQQAAPLGSRCPPASRCPVAPRGCVTKFHSSPQGLARSGPAAHSDGRLRDCQEIRAARSGPTPKGLTPAAVWPPWWKRPMINWRTELPLRGQAEGQWEERLRTSG